MNIEIFIEETKKLGINLTEKQLSQLEKFYELLVLRNFNNMKIYSKLEKVLPSKVLKYYKFLINSSVSDKTLMFRKDGINLLTRKNQKYYFKNSNTVIPYFKKNEYYKLQLILKRTNLPNFYQMGITNLKPNINYDILLTSNIYYHCSLDVFHYIKLLKKFDIPEIQAGYDWYGFDLEAFVFMGCKVDKVLPSSPSEYNREKNYVYSIKK